MSAVSPVRHAASLPQTSVIPLVFPREFLPDERKLAEMELAELAPERAQMVLDEIEGRSRKGRPVDTRLGFLRSLVLAERGGRFRPCYAWEVKSARERVAQQAAAQEARERMDREQAQALRTRLAADTDGKTGYEAFKAFASRWQRRGAVGDETGDETAKP